MRVIFTFVLYACLVACSTAFPIPGDGIGSNRNQPVKDKGKAKAEPPPWPRTGTPTPFTDPNVPLPGRTEVYHDCSAGIATAFYGDDDLPEHVEHIERNHAAYPQNRLPMRASTPAEIDRNRAEALRGIPSGGFWHCTEHERYRDEKQIAMLYHDNHAETTTVEYVPKYESNDEGKLTRKLKAKMEKTGSMGQIRPNRGWSRLDANQQVGHEAPAKVPENEHQYRPHDPPDPNTSHPGESSRKRQPKPPPQESLNVRPETGQGYQPVRYGSDMAMRYRKDKEAPPAPSDSENKGKARRKATLREGTYLQPGRVAPLWSPGGSDKHASHFGAPLTPLNSDTRHSPRPQNHEHYMQQQHESHSQQQAALQGSPQASSSIAASRSEGSPLLIETTPSFQEQMDKVRTASHAHSAHTVLPPHNPLEVNPGVPPRGPHPPMQGRPRAPPHRPTLPTGGDHDLPSLPLEVDAEGTGSAQSNPAPRRRPTRQQTILPVPAPDTQAHLPQGARPEPRRSARNKQDTAK